MKYYIIYLSKGKVIAIESYPATAREAFVAEYKHDKLRLAYYKERFDIDDVQILINP